MCADHATVIHPFVSAIADLSGSLVKPSDWNHGHTFQGGIDGDLLTKDASQTDGVLFKSVLSHILGRLLNVQVGNDSQNNSASPTIDMVNLTIGSHTVKGHFTTPNPNMNVTLNYLTLEWG